MRRIILASGSPRRRELLAQTGLEFEVIPGEVDEDAVVKELKNGTFDTMGSCNCAVSGEAAVPNTERSREGEIYGEEEAYPAQVVKALSFSKAEAVAEQISEGIVIGSDTIVWDGEVLGKPRDRTDAYRMLHRLQGRVHSVFTGVTVLVKEPTDAKSMTDAGTVADIQKHTFFCETKVEVYPMTEKEIEAYLDTGEAMDKAGAYGIQGKFGLWIRRIEGDYNSVVGLPLSALWQVLKRYV